MGPEKLKLSETMSEFIVLKNERGSRVELSCYGASINRIQVAMSNGELRDTVIYCDHESFLKQQGAYAGATVGRFANRINEGRFTLADTTYQTDTNLNGHCLHGGTEGFSHRTWELKELTESRAVMTLVSPAGDQGFPGELHVDASFEWFDNDVLTIQYKATCDAPTPINITAHPYFNLDVDQDTVLRHKLTVESDRFYPIDATGIPTSDAISVENSGFDFRLPKILRADLMTDEQQHITRGYDHCYLIQDQQEIVQKMCRLEASDTQLSVEIFSNMPSLQVYTGNWLEGTCWGENRFGKAYQGIGLEPQFAPNSVNHATWPDCVFSSERPYLHTIEYRFIRA